MNILTGQLALAFLFLSMHSFAAGGQDPIKNPTCLLDLQAYFSDEMNIRNSDIQGDTFVGGNVHLKNFTINGDLSVVGHVSAKDGTITGHTLVNSADLIKVGHRSIKRNQSANLYTRAVKYQDQMFKLSKTLMEMPSNIHPKIDSGTISITADHELSVVSLSAIELKEAYKLTLKGDGNSFLVINIDNEKLDRAEFFRMTLELEGILPKNVIYNFHNAQNLLLGMVGPVERTYGTGIQGTLIAPYASVKFFMGVIDGGLYAHTLEEGLPTGQVDPVKTTSKIIRKLTCE